jgi:hypothetical protein
MTPLPRVTRHISLFVLVLASLSVLAGAVQL